MNQRHTSTSNQIRPSLQKIANAPILPQRPGSRILRRKVASSLLKNLEMESFLVLVGRCWSGAVELDVIF
jgi:hypothetical protein